MFERFTDGARQAISWAQEEAYRQEHARSGPDHLVVGLLLEQDGLAAQVLEAHGLTVDKARAKMQKGFDTSVRKVKVQFGDDAKTALELAPRESLSLGHGHVGTEHILLALIRQWHPAAAALLELTGLDDAALRAEVIKKLTEAMTPPEKRPFDLSIEASDDEKRKLSVLIDEIQEPYGSLAPEHPLRLVRAHLHGEALDSETAMKFISWADRFDRAIGPFDRGTIFLVLKARLASAIQEGGSREVASQAA